MNPPDDASCGDVSCADLAAADHAYGCYVRAAIDVPTAVVFDAASGSSATHVLQLEIVHTDAVCQVPLADACVHVTAEASYRFVAPAPGAGATGVSYWHRPALGAMPWERLSPDQMSDGPEVMILGQTLPPQLSTSPGAGYLHYPANPPDGWTVRVGIAPAPGADAPAPPMTFGVTVSARPYAAPVSKGFTVSA